MEASYRSNPFLADIDWSNPPKAPDYVPPRPKAPPRIRDPSHRCRVLVNVFEPPVVKEESTPSAKKESD